MNRDQIIEMQRRIGTIPDGFWGPKSIAAVQSYLRSLMPANSPWPGTSQGELIEFYGAAGDESKLVPVNVAGLGVKYDGQDTSTIRCHRKCAESLRRVIAALSKSHPEILAQYAGCFNNRPMRGGTTPSLHARGAAIDFDPDTNGNHTSWPVVATMPLAVMEAFAREGWIAAGAFWGRDAMHFQATK